MKIKIEGKLKDGFFKWYVDYKYPPKKWDSDELFKELNVYSQVERLKVVKKLFKNLTKAEQFGSLQEYADTLGYEIIITHDSEDWWDVDIDREWQGTNKSRPEAQVAAIAQLNKIINKDK